MSKLVSGMGNLMRNLPSHTKKMKFWRGEVEWDRNEGRKLRQRVINFVILVDDASVPS